MRLKTNPRDKGRAKVKYDTAKLKDENIRKAFTIALKTSYDVLKKEETEQEDERAEEDIQREFNVMMKAYTEAAKTVLGKPRRRKKNP